MFSIIGFFNRIFDICNPRWKDKKLLLLSTLIGSFLALAPFTQAAFFQNASGLSNPHSAVGSGSFGKDSAAWAFDLLARVERWQLTGPLDFLPTVAKQPAIPAANQARLQAGYGRLPMHFEPNLGQTAEDVKFVARGPGYTLFLTANEAVLALRQGQLSTNPEHQRHPPLSFEPPLSKNQESTLPGAVVRMRLEGATRNTQPTLEGLERFPGTSNYFLGNDPMKWRTNIPHYQRVQYKSVYPGIDLVYYGNPQQLEYDFLLAPGADPNDIRLAFEGVEGMKVADNGDLILRVAGGELVQKAPRIYQDVDGEQSEVAGRYVLRVGDQEQLAFTPTSDMEEVQVGFQVASYQSDRSLAIDPVLIYSTYLGGSLGDAAFGIAVDPAGNAYVTGWTWGTDFPTKNPLQANFAGDRVDVIIAKINSDGTDLAYSTYLGGGKWDVGLSVAVDSTGNAFITGQTSSPDFPVAGNPVQPSLNGFQDAFVAKLNAAGNALIYSTYLGGSSVNSASGIAIDANGNAYITGGTDSTDFPGASTNPIQSSLGGSTDAFVAKINTAGTALVYSMYLGSSKVDVGYGIAIDATGNAYITGETCSTDFPGASTSSIQPSYRGLICNDSVTGANAFVVKINPIGTGLIYSTYLGGSRRDVGYSVAVDSAGNAYVTGSNTSPDFPMLNPLQPSHLGLLDAFVTKVNPSGTALVYSTYLGGSTDDSGTGIAVDAVGNAYVMGWTWSTDFPTSNPLQSSFAGVVDAFVTKINPSGTALMYSTYLGGNGYENNSHGWTAGAITVDAAGNAYVAGATTSTDFPGASVSPIQPTFGGGFGGDAYVAKIEDEGSTSVTLTVAVTGSGTVTSTPAGIDCGPTCSASFSTGTSVTLTATPAVGSTFAGWSPVECGGPLTLSADTTCTATFNLTNRPPIANAGPDQIVEGAGPNGTSVTLDGSASSDPDNDSLTFAWTGPFGTASGSKPTVTLPLGTHTITLTVNDGHGGTASDTVSVQVRDTTPPVLNLPADINVTATSPTGATVSYTASATDLVSGAITPTCTPASGNTFPIGATTVTCAATDQAGNKASGSFKVTVIDTTPPSTIAFSAFGINKLAINQRLKTFVLLSNFTLGQGSNGIDPVNEPVTLTIASFTATVPAGSFRKGRLGVYAFAGKINNVAIEALIAPLGGNRFGFQAAAYGASLSGATNPVTVGLAIGNDGGTATVNNASIR